MARKRALTLKDLAAELELGITTVSDILLRGKTNYRAETVERVKAAADKLGYRPNALAQGIRSGKTRTIGLVVTFNILDPFFAELVNRLEERFEAEGLMVLLSISEDNIEKDRRVISFLESRRVDGILVGPIYKRRSVEAHYDHYQSRVPTVMFLAEEDAPYDTVNLEGRHRAIGRRVGEHFLAHGHRRIAYLCCPEFPQKHMGNGSHRGFHEALEAAGAYDESLIWIEKRPLAEVAYARMKQVLAETPRSKLPTAIYCHNDHCAIGAMAALREAGLRCPRDISLIGTDNIVASAFADPPLTTLDLKPVAIADAAFEMLMERLKKPRQALQRRHVAPEFVERASVRAV
jgi:DNA-binding LacI/PurR family transcriptional regulator